MLVRIMRIQGVGLLADVKAASHKLERVALIYGENGRGKSTLASIFRSVSLGDPSIIQERKTVDSPIDPEIQLQFDNGHTVSYASGTWSERREEFCVFGTEFIDSNVCSGGEVKPAHRKNLLEFALGARAVAAKAAEELASQEWKEASGRITSGRKELQGYCRAASLGDFLALPDPGEVDVRLAEFSRRHADALRATPVLSHSAPGLLEVPLEMSVDEAFALLGSELEGLHDEAETAVAGHIKTLHGDQAERWLGAGQVFDNGTTCPYCGQPTMGLELLSMYRTHFNAAYQQLRERVEAGLVAAEAWSTGAPLLSLSDEVERQNELLRYWAEYCDVGPVEYPEHMAAAVLRQLADLLGAAFRRKLSDLGESTVRSGEPEEAKRLWDQFCGFVNDLNFTLATHGAKVADYKAKLAGDDPVAVAAEIETLELSKTRHSELVLSLVKELRQAEADLAAADVAKDAARDALTAVMTQTLSVYQSDINYHLLNLGTGFTIDKISTNYLGGSPRTDYVVKLRGKAVKLTGGIPSFATALSEGDKRTLAFAFFAACVLADPSLDKKIVVIDDAVNSLDRSRRQYTKSLLVEMAKRAEQVIVLSHDPNFVRAVRDDVRKLRVLGTSAMRLTRVVHDYSDFADVDIDRECESSYFRNYRAVSEFVAGKQTDPLIAAAALRPLLEGCLHRRFPGGLPRGKMLGEIVEHIDATTAPDPVAVVKGDSQVLRDLNAYAARFHHDSNPDYRSEQADAGEVLAFARRVLDFVHGARVPSAADGGM